MLTLPLITLNHSFFPWVLWAGTLGAVLVAWKVWAARHRDAALEAERLAEKRANNLARILEIGNTMNATSDLDRLLSGIAEGVRESLGFRMVLVRLLDESADVFRARAFAGLDETAVAKLREHEIPLGEFQDLMREEFRVSRSYFISHETQYWDQNDERLVIPDLGDRREGEWHPLDSLFVPLLTRERRLIGYLSVDDPVDRKVPSREVIDTLEIFSNQAVTAIENAQLYRDLEAKISELRSMTRKLEDLNQTKSAIMANVSHEFRTPLTSIRAYLDTVIADVGPGLDSQRRHFLDVIGEETVRLTHLVEDLLNFSKMEDGASDLNRIPVRLEEVVRAGLGQVAAEVRRKELTVTEDFGETGPVQAEPDLISQLVLNLLRNAVKFTDSAGRITIRIREDGDGLLLLVEDTGIGIPNTDLEKVFETFYQTDSSMTRKFGGVGLGLAASRRIVQQHGGRIWVESEENKGSRFHVWLPKHGTDRSETPPCGRSFERRRNIADFVVELIAEVMEAKSASIMTVDPENKDLFIETALGLHDEIMRNSRVRVGQGVSGWVAQHGRPLLVRDIEEDERIGRRNRPTYETKSLLSVPLKAAGTVVGVLNVSNKITCTPFTQDDASLLGTLAERLSLVLERVREQGSEVESFAPTVRALCSIIDAHRRNHMGAPPRILNILSEMCLRLKIPVPETEVLRYIASVYDVGMAEVDEGIISKTGRLEPEEIEEIRGHPQAGVDILSPIEFVDDVKRIILHHHERWDGSGYPEGLAGEAIPLGARVLGVVDAFRSMTSERPYRRARSAEEAVAELRNCAGTQFDPEVVDVFVNARRDTEHSTEKPEPVMSSRD